MKTFRKYLRTGSDDLMPFEEYRAIMRRRFSRKYSRAVIRIVPILLCFFLVGCQSVPPSVIGSETRAGLDTLSAQQTASAITTERLGAATGEVSAGLESLADRVPAAFKNETTVLAKKSAVTESLVSTLQGQLATERATTEKIKASDLKNSESLARSEAARVSAEKAELKAKNERNIAVCVIILTFVILIAGFLAFRKR